MPHPFEASRLVLQVGHAAVHVGELGAELGHLVHFVHALPSQEVEPVEVFPVAGHAEVAVGRFDGEDGLEDGALAVLYPLPHGVEVGGEVYGCGENAFVPLAPAFAVELLPPLADVVELGVVVGEGLFPWDGSGKRPKPCPA